MTQKKVNNALYKTTLQIGASRLVQILWYLVNICFFKNPLNVSSGIKVSLLRLFGARVGVGVVIKPSVNIKYPWKLIVGNHAWIGEGVWIDNLSDVHIGDHAVLSQGALLLTGNHDAFSETFDFRTAPIVLEEGVWICSKAIVAGGVTCRSHSILSIASVTGKDLEPYTIYRGNPAVPVRQRVIG